MRLFKTFISKFFSFISSLLIVLSITSVEILAQKANPDFSVNVLTQYQQSKRQGEDKAQPGGGLSLQEAELQFMADVDPYMKAVVLLGIHAHHHEDEESSAVDPGDGSATVEAQPEELSYAIEPEEVYLETLKLPYLTVKAGRFYAALGRHNQLHAHAYPFLDAPLIHQKLLGEEGLAETGVSLAALMPLPWFMEVTAQALQGDSSEMFSSASSTDIAGVYRIRNMFELNDDTSLDIGLSGASGANFYEQRTDVRGADVTLKWRPAQGGKYTAMILGAETLQGEVRGRPEESKLAGYAGWIQYQFGERWWVQYRGEEVNDRDDGGKVTNKMSALIGFFPSEFSGFRLQFDHVNDEQEKPLNSIALQANFTIGAHPAHTF